MSGGARGLDRRQALAGGLAGLGLLGCGERELAPTLRDEGDPRGSLATVRVRLGSDRGHADHGWLDTYHTFSFAGYHDPDFTGFGPLRVINQDRVAAGRGFPMHGHRDMEIVSYVLAGTMEHRDTMGNGSQMRPGDVQLMSAGRGVQHSEFNASSTEGLHFLQMWVLPRETGVRPRYEQRAFTSNERSGGLRLVVSPDGADDSLTIGQDARLYASIFGPGDRARHRLAADRAAWLHVAEGVLEVNGVALGPGDGAALVGGDVDLRGAEASEFVLWDLPAS